MIKLKNYKNSHNLPIFYYTRFIFAFLAVSIILYLSVISTSLEQREAEGTPIRRHSKLTIKASSTRLKRSKFPINLRNLRKQRLKPLYDKIVIGGDSCPGGSNYSAVSGNEYRTRSLDIRNIKCPKFENCHRNLNHIWFCRVPSIKSFEPLVQFRPPQNTNGKSWRGLSYYPTSLPWDGHVVMISEPLFVNFIGQTFNHEAHYLHGGCQDISDNDHGGDRKYEKRSTKIRRLDTAINLIHLYGDNFYHFLIEVLPRFYMMKFLIEKNPDIPILCRKNSPLHLLRLIGIDYRQLNIVELDREELLIHVTRHLYMPLAPRCLHMPTVLWSEIREWFAHGSHDTNGLLNVLPDFRLHRESANDKILMKVVYFSRKSNGNRRNLKNENELFEAIADKFNITKDLDDSSTYKSDSSDFSFQVLHGNETLEYMIETINSADMVMGPHGAGLSNSIFLPSGATLFEIGPSTGYWNPCFMYLANSINLNHILIKANGSQNTELYLDPDQITQILDWISANYHSTIST